MITHAETWNKDVFDWRLFLRFGRMQDEWAAALELATCWRTCAVGVQSEALPREDDGQPVDGALCDMGGDFYVAIRDQQPISALSAIDSIEARASLLLEEMGHE